MRPVLLLSFALALAGCVAPIHEFRNQFRDEDFAAIPVTGSGIITGQAFLKTMGGDVKFGAGNPVDLIPQTPYTLERFGNAGADEQMPPRPPALAKYVRTTQADGNGNFEFRDVPAGKYILHCAISWSVSQYELTGGNAFALVTVEDGKTVKAVVTR